MSVDFTTDLGERGDELNFNSANGAALLDAMGFGGRLLEGECSIAEARRGVIRARNRRSITAYTRVAVNERRCFSPEFTEEDLAERIDRFSRFVESNAAAGATVVRWY